MEEQRVYLKVRPAQGDLMITCDVIILITSVCDEFSYCETCCITNQVNKLCVIQTLHEVQINRLAC